MQSRTRVTPSEAKAMTEATNENPPELKEDDRWVSPEIQRAIDGEQVEFKLGSDAVDNEAAKRQDPEIALGLEDNQHPSEASGPVEGAIVESPEPEEPVAESEKG